MNVTSGTMERTKKPWAKFHAHFQASQRKYKMKQKVSTRLAEYQGAYNHQATGEETHKYLVNLEVVAAADRDTMMNQIKTISDLIKTTANLTQQLKKSDREY